MHGATVVTLHETDISKSVMLEPYHVDRMPDYAVVAVPGRWHAILRVRS